MEKLKIWGPVIGILGSIVTAVMGAGPLGAILAGVGAIAVTILSIFAYNKYKNWQFDSAHKKENEKNVEDHGKVIEENQAISADDEASLEQSKKDKDNAFEVKQ